MPELRSFARALALGATLALPLGAQARPTDGYLNSQRFNAAIDEVARSKPNLIKVSTLATSPGRRPVQLVRIGGAEDRPALLILAGAYGPQLTSSEVALRIVRELARRHGSDTAVTRLLGENTIYVIPRINPDASEAFFAPLRTERTGNDTPSDDDRDHAMDEDAPDDLNGDGMITQMRVRAPGGEWMPDPADPALLRRADPTKGERGIYKVFVEGRDNDGDENYNEDGIGGTDLSRNFPNNYPWFTAGAGVGPLSETETRAIAEFVSTQLNVAAVYVLGMQDNVLRAWEGRRVPGISGRPQGTSAGGPFTAPLPEDNSWFTELSRRFKATTGWSEGPASANDQGDLASWSYFHMGRYTVASRVWGPTRVAGDSAGARRAPGGQGGAGGPGGAGADPIAEQRTAYKWLQANHPAGLVAWAPVNGFTIEGQPVEVGGFAPFATLNPPGTMLDSIARKHTDFVVELTGLLPATTVENVKVTEVGPRVYRISADVVNHRYLATNAAIGVRARHTLRVKVELGLGRNQTLQSGRVLTFINALGGSGGRESYEWVVLGEAGSTVTLTAGAPSAGLVTQTITLRAR